MSVLISVIVPVYNTEPYLPRCIDSILGQSFTDFELLLVDDGSTDGSGAICDAYAAKDSRVRVFHKENGGVSSARNLGLDNAKGEWVTFIDSDDFIEDDYFSVSLEENVDLCVQNWKFANGLVRDWFESQVVFQEECVRFLKDNIHTDMFRTVCCFFFLRKILVDNNIKFDTRFRLGEDTLFVMDYYRCVNSIRVMANSCYIYNRQDDWNDKYCLSFVEAQDYLNEFMDRYDSLPCGSSRLLGVMFTFIPARIRKEERPSNLKWALSRIVLRYKKAQLPYKGMRYRVKYFMAKAMSVFIYD